MVKTAIRRTVEVRRARRALQRHPRVCNRVSVAQAKAYMDLEGADPTSRLDGAVDYPAWVRTGRRPLAFYVWYGKGLLAVVLTSGETWIEET